MNLLDFALSVLSSRVFWSVGAAYLLAHVTKFFLHFYRFRKWSILPFFDTGGMPSSHTATTVALTASIGITLGPTPLFLACALFTLIIIRDSYGVRQSVGDMAKIMNAITSEMKVHRKVTIVLGHTPLQVLVGLLVGLIAATAVCLL